MNETAGPTEPGESLTQTLDKTIRIAVIVALAAWCFGVLAPFLVPMSWGIIIAVASHGFYEKLTGYLGGSRKLATTVYIVLGMALLLVPTIMLAETAVSSGRRLASEMEQGSFEIPPPPARVADWPLVGPKVSDLWSEASSSPPKMLSSLTPQLKVVGTWLLSSVASLGLVLIQFVISIIIAGVLLAHSEAGGRIANGLALRLAPRQGEELAVLARNTLRSVSRGIVGVAIIQAAMAGLGFAVVGMPGAGFWAAVALLLSVIQIGVLPVMLPAIIWCFATSSTLVGVLFLIWCIVVGLTDNVLKPILLGRGVDVPMLVVFMGSIGGFIAHGIIGLFIGAVLLVLGYKLFLLWLHEAPEQETSSA